MLRRLCLVVPIVFQLAAVHAQQTASVPRLVRFTGTLHGPVNLPTGIVGASFAIYREQEGGTPLWVEEQNVQLDRSAGYTVLLGVPVELFSAGEPWLEMPWRLAEGLG